MMTDRTLQAIKQLKQDKKRKRRENRDTFFYLPTGSQTKEQIRGRIRGGFGVAENIIVHLNTGVVIFKSYTRHTDELYRIATRLDNHDIGGRYSNLGNPDEGTLSPEEMVAICRGIRSILEVIDRG